MTKEERADARVRADNAQARLNAASLTLREGVDAGIPDEKLTELRSEFSSAARMVEKTGLSAAPLRGPSEGELAIERTKAELQAAIAKAGA